MTVLSASLADPTGTSAIVAAASWIEGTLLGTVATTLAVIAVAGFGFLMLTGRLHLRRGATVLLGCFLLFGALTIANGLRALRDEDEAVMITAPAPAATPLVPLPRVTPTPTVPYDPYAGAAVPTTR